MMTFFSMSKSSAQAGPQDVGQQIDGLGHILRQDAGVENRVLLAGVGVVLGPDAVEVAVDVEGRAARRPLEDHVLEKMRHAGNFRRLIAGAGADEEADGHGTGGRVGFADDVQAIGEDVMMKLQRNLLM